MLNPAQDGLRLNRRITENRPTLLSIFDENKDIPAVAEFVDMNACLAGQNREHAEQALRWRDDAVKQVMSAANRMQ